MPQYGRYDMTTDIFYRPVGGSICNILVGNRRNRICYFWLCLYLIVTNLKLYLAGKIFLYWVIQVPRNSADSWITNRISISLCLSPSCFEEMRGISLRNSWICCSSIKRQTSFLRENIVWHSIRNRFSRVKRKKVRVISEDIKRRYLYFFHDLVYNAFVFKYKYTRKQKKYWKVGLMWILVSFVPSYELPVIRNREVSLQETNKKKKSLRTVGLCLF